MVERVVFLDGAPRELADQGDGGEVDAMLLATLELGEGVLFVTVVHHQHVPVPVEVHVSFVHPLLEVR